MKMNIHGEDVDYEFPMRHCVDCTFFAYNINEDPCRPCLNSGEYPGRERPLWEQRKSTPQLTRQTKSTQELVRTKKPKTGEKKKVIKQRSLF